MPYICSAPIFQTPIASASRQSNPRCLPAFLAQSHPSSSYYSNHHLNPPLSSESAGTNVVSTTDNDMPVRVSVCEASASVSSESTDRRTTPRKTRHAMQLPSASVGSAKKERKMGPTGATAMQAEKSVTPIVTLHHESRKNDKLQLRARGFQNAQIIQLSAVQERSCDSGQPVATEEGQYG